MHKLNNSLQYYDWGSTTALTALYGIADPQGRPLAELWMGAHPKSPSTLVTEGQPRSLRDAIARDPVAMLGRAVADRFGELPFLFKVLCAAKALSVQAHPDKHAAAAGFARENAAGIAPDAPQRSYKDASHKPELLYALTPFQALNGFRERPEMVSLLSAVAGAHPQIGHFIEQATPDALARLFATLFSLQGDEKRRALAILCSVAASRDAEPWLTVRQLAADYPDDNGLFAPLLLNQLLLQPGEAMFLSAGTPHAYLQGTALEVMANSDNVLRAGLTPKFIDMPELLANLNFTARAAGTLRLQPERDAQALHFPVPVDDFAFAIHLLSAVAQPLAPAGVALLFCIEGEARLASADSQLILQPGESCFVTAREAPIAASGSGRLARVFCALTADG